MKIVVDMNLSPAWAEFLKERGHEAVHWSYIGPAGASDAEIMSYAYKHRAVVFTHDLDFGTILVATQARGPSVIQIRADDPLPASMGTQVVAALAEHANLLDDGALITVEPERGRARILPIVPGWRRESS